MKILLTGSGGLIGRALSKHLESEGHELIRLVRSIDDGDSTVLLWKPQAPEMANTSRLEGLDAVIHLAGESIADSRWKPEKKLSIRNSRVQGTGFLANTLAGLQRKPKLFLSASAMGYYPDHGEQWIDETNQMGTSFLAGVCRDWEAATRAAEEAGIRTLHLRFSMILSKTGGALKQMMTPFSFGLGGNVGTGSQYWSWISLEDCVRSIDLLLHQEEMSGPVNISSPNPATNREFTKALGHALHRPTLLPLPAFAARMVLGEMADELLLKSQRLSPSVLNQAGFTFNHADLREFLSKECNAD